MRITWASFIFLWKHQCNKCWQCQRKNWYFAPAKLHLSLWCQILVGARLHKIEQNCTKLYKIAQNCTKLYKMISLFGFQFQALAIEVAGHRLLWIDEQSLIAALLDWEKEPARPAFFSCFLFLLQIYASDCFIFARLVGWLVGWLVGVTNNFPSPNDSSSFAYSVLFLLCGPNIVILQIFSSFSTSTSTFRNNIYNFWIGIFISQSRIHQVSTTSVSEID